MMLVFAEIRSKFVEGKTLKPVFQWRSDPPDLFYVRRKKMACRPPSTNAVGKRPARRTEGEGTIAAVAAPFNAQLRPVSSMRHPSSARPQATGRELSLSLPNVDVERRGFHDAPVPDLHEHAGTGRLSETQYGTADPSSPIGII